MSNDNTVLFLSSMAAVAMVLSARADATAPRRMGLRSVDDADRDDDPMSDIGQWVKDFVKLERRVVEEEAERLESMVEKIEERQTKGDDLLDRIASDSVVKSYLDKVDDRIGELMSKLSRKPDVDQEEVNTYSVSLVLVRHVLICTPYIF